MKLTRYLIILSTLAVAASLSGLPNPSYLNATCTGSDPCNACKNASTASVARKKGVAVEFVKT